MNLQLGLQLGGGMRIRALLVGVTAEDVEFEGDSGCVVERQVVAQIAGADAVDIIVRTGVESSTVETTIENVTADDLSVAFGAAGYARGEVRDGVIGTTRTETARVLQPKTNEVGLSSGTIQQVTMATGEHFILIEAPGHDQSDVVDLVGERGAVQTDIYYPTGADNGSRAYEIHETALTQVDFTSIETAQEPRTGSGAFVPVPVRDDSATGSQTAVQDTGLAQPGGT